MEINRHNGKVVLNLDETLDKKQLLLILEFLLSKPREFSSDDARLHRLYMDTKYGGDHELESKNVIS